MKTIKPIILSIAILAALGLFAAANPAFALGDSSSDTSSSSSGNSTTTSTSTIAATLADLNSSQEKTATNTGKAAANEIVSDRADDAAAQQDTRETVSGKVTYKIPANSKGPKFPSQGSVVTNGTDSYEGVKENNSTIAYKGSSNPDTQLMQIHNDCVVIDNTNAKTYFVPGKDIQEWTQYKQQASGLGMTLHGVCRSLDLPKLCNENVAGSSLVGGASQTVHAGENYTATAVCSASGTQCGSWSYKNATGSCCPAPRVDTSLVNCPSPQVGKINISVSTTYALNGSSPGCVPTSKSTVDTSNCKVRVCPATSSDTASSACPSGYTGSKVTTTTKTYTLSGANCNVTTTTAVADNCTPNPPTNSGGGGGGGGGGWDQVSWTDNGDGTHTTTITNYNSNGTVNTTQTQCGNCSNSGLSGYSSDIRLKEKVADLDGAKGLDTILKLRPVTWHWRDVAQDKLEGEQVGFIAQEVAKEFPSLLINTGKDITLKLADGTTEVVKDSKALDYAKLTAPLVKAVQELKAENDKNAAAIKDLAAQFEAYKATHK